MSLDRPETEKTENDSVSCEMTVTTHHSATAEERGHTTARLDTARVGHHNTLTTPVTVRPSVWLRSFARRACIVQYLSRSSVHPSIECPKFVPSAPGSPYLTVSEDRQRFDSIYLVISLAASVLKQKCPLG